MTKTAVTQPETTMVPVTTMEKMPLLSADERAEMIASLEKAEAAIAAEQGRSHDPQTFVAEMQALRAAAKRSREV